MNTQNDILVETDGRGIYDITTQLKNLVRKYAVSKGLCHIFCQHTSCSLILCENFDDSVKNDIETYLSDLVVDGDKRFTHTIEGRDDMSAHIRTLLTKSDITVPIVNNQLLLGQWQGINLYEHRYRPHNRKLVVTLMG